MKAGLFIRVLLILLVGGLQACSGGGDREISVTDSDDSYEFYAKFERHKTRQVQDFIHAKITPTHSITEEHVPFRTGLDDKTHFELEESPGMVRIRLDKEASSDASYRRVKTFCEKIKIVINKQ